jgi:hypothetical protein
LLREIKIVAKIAKPGLIFAHVRARIPAAVDARIQTRAVQKIVLDERRVTVAREVSAALAPRDANRSS